MPACGMAAFDIPLGSPGIAPFEYGCLDGRNRALACVAFPCAGGPVLCVRADLRDLAGIDVLPRSVRDRHAPGARSCRRAYF